MLDEKNNESVKDEIDTNVEEKNSDEKIDSLDLNKEDKPAEKKKEENVTEVIEVEKKEEEKKLDYESFQLDELVDALGKLLKNESIPQIKENVEKVKTAFNKKFGALLADKKEAFLNEGGNIIDFSFSSPLKSQYNGFLFEYKEKKQQYYAQKDKELKANLEAKLQIIEELKDLIENASPDTMYKDYKALEKRWKEIGAIPSSKYNNTWQTYYHHVERFYDLLHLNKDYRDHDFKNNLEVKLNLIKKVKSLAEMQDVNLAFRELQEIHRMWKEDVGPVAIEKREEIWKQFRDVTAVIHDKKHELSKELRSKFDDNFNKKLAIIKKIDNLVNQEINSHAKWQNKINELENIKKEFFNVGKINRYQNEQVWKLFKEATKNFNRAKNNFYKEIKTVQQTNLTKKQALLAKAIALKDSNDWENASQQLKKIQAEWKLIGHVPRKISDKIWEEFKQACNCFFDRLHKLQDGENEELIENFKKKKELLEQFKDQQTSVEQLSLETVKSYITDWNNLGIVPSNMRHIDSKFYKAIDKIVSQLNLDSKTVEIIKFANIVDGYVQHKNYNKIEKEQFFVRKKIDEINKQIQQLENNISFINSSSDDNPLLLNVRKNIKEYSDNLEVWKEKLSYLRKLEF